MKAEPADCERTVRPKKPQPSQQALFQNCYFSGLAQSQLSQLSHLSQASQFTGNSFTRPQPLLGGMFGLFGF